MGEPMDRSKLVFMELGPFQRAFPRLESAVVEFTEFNLHLKGRSGRWRLEWDGGLMECGNSSCRRGGYRFDREVHRMVRENLTEQTFRIHCPGDEGSPKGRKRGRRCERYVTGKITLQYKDTLATADVSPGQPSSEHTDV